MQMPANCINTNGPFAPGVREVILRVCRKPESERQIASVAFGAIEKADSTGGHGYRGAINFDKLYYPRYILSRMKSSGPCLPSLSATPLRTGCPPSVPSLAAASTSHCGCTPVIAGEGDMRLVPLERKRCHFLHAIFLAPTIVRSFPILPSPTLPDLSVPPRVLARLIPLGINPPFLYSANVFPIFLLRSTYARSQPLSPHLHAVMYPLLVFPALSSALIPTLLFPRTFSSIFPPLKSMPVCSRPFHHACSLPSFFPALQAILSIFLFGAPLPGNVPDFRCHCRFPSARASMRRTCVHLRINPSSLFPPLLCPVCHPSLCPGDSFVTIGIRMPPSRLASHFS